MTYQTIPHVQNLTQNSGFAGPSPLDRKAHAGVLNLQKQAGFYVDRVSQTITAPVDAEVGDMRLALIRAAQVAEMLLISDHTRTQYLPAERQDSTMDLQMRVMPYSHPDEFFEASDKSDDGPEDELPPPPHDDDVLVSPARSWAGACSWFARSRW